MIDDQENHAHNIRQAGQRQKEAEENLARAQAMEKMTFAKAQMEVRPGAKSLRIDVTPIFSQKYSTLA